MDDLTFTVNGWQKMKPLPTEDEIRAAKLHVMILRPDVKNEEAGIGDFEELVQHRIIQVRSEHRLLAEELRKA